MDRSVIFHYDLVMAMWGGTPYASDLDTRAEKDMSWEVRVRVERKILSQVWARVGTGMKNQILIRILEQLEGEDNHEKLGRSV